MKLKKSIGIFILLVSVIMLMGNAIASGGAPVWLNQATLSTIDIFSSQDPENSGFGLTQVTVWEEWNGGDWDIYMKYSLADGALLTWVFPALHPATIPNVDEINPAVAVTNLDPVNGLTEIHVVYQRWNPGPPAQWDVCHTWTNNWGAGWTVPVVLDNVPARDAIDPAIVYTEDLSNPGVGLGMLVQFTWAELNPAAFYEIYYRAFYLDIVPVPPVRAYVGAFLIRATNGHCEKPEIASVDERLTAGVYDYYFAIVWQEPGNVVPINLNIWYVDGTTTINPLPRATVLTAGSLGQLNPVIAPPVGDCYDPDIAATQDYQAVETYYFHVDWVYNVWAVPPAPATWQIDTCYAVGALPTPGAAAFVATAPARAAGVIVLDRPTIASKVVGLGPPFNFETWMCWEDNSMPGSNPEIYYAVGLYTGLAPPFAFTAGPARVTYGPIVGSNNFNPELWNRDDSTRLMPPLTHLVFDQTIGVITEIEYIDP